MTTWDRFKSWIRPRSPVYNAAVTARFEEPEKERTKMSGSMLSADEQHTIDKIERQELLAEKKHLLAERDQLVDQAVKHERARLKEIVTLGWEHGVPTAVINQAIWSGESPGEFATSVLRSKRHV